ncbi:ImmA/IrrE family metallo-endopeptidase [Bacillaceae bacterium Marseille-Q3522]|nr:ImmA/IrrE family metallo-endopeptidase [Bacillaceae bacterium Marseille-Q3522]
MSEPRQTIRLSDAEIAEIQRQARAKLGECKKTQDIIGTQIFSILSLYARVFYYPLGKAGPWGITCMGGMDSAAPAEKPFAAINTSIPVDAQVFAAAHELYHIWYDRKAEAILSSILGESDECGAQLDISERRANRFAAEFLVDEDLLQREMRLYSITPRKITVKDILRLAALFTVPYRTMVKRLHEIGAISQTERDEYLRKDERSIEQLRKRYSFTIPDTDNRIVLDNLVELAVAAYEKQRISYEKLEYLLSINNLIPGDVGIAEPASFVPPSDDELDDIMEE